MIRISIREDYRRMERILTDFERRQLPFATARALTQTVQLAKVEEERRLSTAFDRPTPFTQRAIAIVTASKSTLRAEVFVRPIQAGYLALPEAGGMRRPKKAALVNPANTRLNQYGNIPYKALARLKRRRDVFVGKVGNVGGLWQRPKPVKGKVGKLKLLMRFAGPQRVKRNPWFMPVIHRVARQQWRPLMREALAEALRTARR